MLSIYTPTSVSVATDFVAAGGWQQLRETDPASWKADGSAQGRSHRSRSAGDRSFESRCARHCVSRSTSAWRWGRWGQRSSHVCCR